MTLTMYDSDVPGGIPVHATVVAGYVDGGDYNELVALFPHATHFSISCNATIAADCLDVEHGDASAGQVELWIEEQRRGGAKRPCVYASIDSYMPAVIAALAHVPRDTYRLWVAHWTPDSPPTEVPAGYDAVQWLATEGFDQSLLVDDFFTGPPPPPPACPTLSPAQKSALQAVRDDLIGIIRQQGQLTEAEFDQLKLAYARISGIPGVKP